MKKYIRKITGMLVAIIMVFTLSITALAAEASTSPSENMTLQGGNTINAVITYQKTVTNYYANFSSIPESIFYSEYNNSTLSWFQGTLYLQKVVASGTGYSVTYTGTMVGTGL